MIREEMLMSPKGQVVIPRLIRTAAGLHPRGPVIVAWDGRQVTIGRPQTDVVELARRVAFSGKHVRLDPHEAYEGELEEKWKRIERANRGKK